MPTAQELVVVLQQWSNAIVGAGNNAAFLPSERAQLVSAAQNVAWVLIRVNQNTAAVDQDDDLPAVIQAVRDSIAELNGVTIIGDGGPAVAQVFRVIGDVDDLLPVAAQMFQ